MTVRVPSSSELFGLSGAELVCYCTTLTLDELRDACLAGQWPPEGKERTGKLCTGCVGDILHCLRVLGRPAGL